MRSSFLFSYSFLLIALIHLAVGGCSKKHTNRYAAQVSVSPKREFRAAWVATVDNIDWPSKKGLSSEQQQTEFTNLVDKHSAMGLNAVMVQVRAAADAFYARSNEPWSEWLTGVQGKAPDVYYDPLDFMINETHQRNMEFHAWLNLSRGTHKATTSISPNHITKIHPEWFFRYDNHLLFNFGLPEVRAYIIDVVRNLVRFYDVDGIHFDDYFYPYTVAGQRINDDAAFRQYGSGFRSVEDWRRHNVDELILGIGKAIKETKPRVKFGISPFSVWRNASVDPTGSQTQGGQTSYDNLYADTRLWFREGWIDYIAPQVYFTFEFNKVPYQTMTDWWAKQSTDRHIYMGLGVYRVGTTDRDRAWANPSQIPRQIRYNRSIRSIQGTMLYNTNSLVRNNLGVADSVATLFAIPALPPTMPWKDSTPPNAPADIKAKRVKNAGVAVSWKVPNPVARDNEPIARWIVYRFDENQAINLENTAAILAILPNNGLYNYVDKTAQKDNHYIYLVTATDRLHNESPPSHQLLVK